MSAQPSCSRSVMCESRSAQQAQQQTRRHRPLTQAGLCLTLILPWAANRRCTSTLATSATCTQIRTYAHTSSTGTQPVAGAGQRSAAQLSSAQLSSAQNAQVIGCWHA